MKKIIKIQCKVIYNEVKHRQSKHLQFFRFLVMDVTFGIKRKLLSPQFSYTIIVQSNSSKLQAYNHLNGKQAVRCVDYKMKWHRLRTCTYLFYNLFMFCTVFCSSPLLLHT